MNLHLFTWRNAGHLLPQLHELRYRLFIEREGYAVPHYDGLEYDAYDTPATRYALVTCPVRGPVGTLRAVPTDRPILGPILAPDVTFPHSPDIWEVSRIGIDDTELGRAEKAVVISYLLEGLISWAGGYCGPLHPLRPLREFWFYSYPRAMARMLGPQVKIEQIGAAAYKDGPVTQRVELTDAHLDAAREQVQVLRGNGRAAEQVSLAPKSNPG